MVFVQRELNADNVDMVIIVLVGSISACLGLLLLMPIVKRLHGKDLCRMFMALKAVTLVWPVWLALGFTQKWEMFALVVIGGVLNPSLLPTVRSIFQQTCPHGYEASMFSLLGICTVAFVDRQRGAGHVPVSDGHHEMGYTGAGGLHGRRAMDILVVRL